MEELKATSKYLKAKISAKKVAPVMDLVRGKKLETAKVILSFDRTKAAKMILKALKSAEANAVNNAKADISKLYVTDIWVGQGRVIKSGMFAGRGNFRPILKRTSNIFVGLKERIK